MKKVLFLLAIASLTLTSCNKKTIEALQAEKTALQNNYNTLEHSYKSLQTDLHNAEVKLAESNATNKSLEERLADARKQQMKYEQDYASLQNALDKSLTQSNNSSTNIARLVDQIQESNRYIKQLVEAKSKSDSLNLVLTNNLTRSLSKEELRDVDVQVLKGVVYISLNDNMLYKSGSYEISPAAASTLKKIAKIITDYSDYEVLVEGNTDNVPIKQTNIRNNWDLSALRASSVVQELQTKYGVNPSRLTAGGRGEYNPIADNDTETGRSKNRRTQLIITPKLDQFLELIGQAPETDK